LARFARVSLMKSLFFFLLLFFFSFSFSFSGDLGNFSQRDLARETFPFR